MKDLEQDIYNLWQFLWNKGMIGSTKHTDKSGREKVGYFINDYGVRIFSLMRERYKLGGTENANEFFTDDSSTKVLIVCPFCGGKTEQGLLKCQKCGAAL